VSTLQTEFQEVYTENIYGNKTEQLVVQYHATPSY